MLSTWSHGVIRLRSNLSFDRPFGCLMIWTCLCKAAEVFNCDLLTSSGRPLSKYVIRQRENVFSSWMEQDARKLLLRWINKDSAYIEVTLASLNCLGGNLWNQEQISQLEPKTQSWNIICSQHSVSGWEGLCISGPGSLEYSSISRIQKYM